MWDCIWDQQRAVALGPICNSQWLKSNSTAVFAAGGVFTWKEMAFPLPEIQGAPDLASASCDATPSRASPGIPFSPTLTAIDLFTHTRTHTHARTHTYACTHTHTHTHTYVRTHAHAHSVCVSPSPPPLRQNQFVRIIGKLKIIDKFTSSYFLNQALTV